MRLLLDTHMILWWEANHPRLPDAVREMVRASTQPVLVSRASLWEIAIKISIGKMRLDFDAFAANVEADGFVWLDIKNTHLSAVSALPVFSDHKDPFDRLLAAQSQVESLALLTADPALARYGPTVRVF